ncbi:MAG: SH3 domain-containing protein [Syntrophales bacterium]|jgi:hypothetical protein
MTVRKYIFLLLFAWITIWGFSSIAVAADVSVPKLSVYKAFPDISPQVLDASFWIKRLAEPEKILMTEEQIARFNQANCTRTKSVEDIWNTGESISREELLRLIAGVSEPRTAYRYSEKGKRLDSKDFESFAANIDIKGLPESIRVQYGMSVRRTIMRAYPTNKKAMKQKGALGFDHLIESAVYVAEPMLILAESLDRRWLFVQTATVRGWIPETDIAYGNRQEIMDYTRRKPFVIVTSPFVAVTLIDHQAGSDLHIRLDMGIRLPLAVETGLYHEHDAVVVLPLRNEKGRLSFAGRSYISMKDVHPGYLPYTRANIIRQAFMMHGESYGWGGSGNARDCSAFLSDIYKTFGIMVPRNSIDQAFDSVGLTYDFSNLTSMKDRLRLFDSLSAYAPFPIYKPGHAMLYLGSYNGRHYVIHDASGFYTLNRKGKPVRSRIMKVVVFPLEIMHDIDGKAFPDAVRTVREFIYNGQ